MKSRIMTAMIGSGLLLIGGSGVAHADIIQNEPTMGGGSTGQILFFNPRGQSFTAVDPLIGSIGFALSEINFGQPAADVTLILYEGAGFGGSILAERTILDADIVGPGFPGEWNDWVFGSPVSLTVGNVYTARLTTTNAKWGMVQTGSDVYAGGDAYVNGGAVGVDHRFRVLAAPPPIPQPSCDVVIDFESLEQAGSSIQFVGSTYAEDGFTINGATLRSFQLSESRFAGSTGLFEDIIGGTIELVKDDGGVFRLAAINLDPLNDNGSPATVTIIGELGGMQVAMQSFTTSGSLTFETFIFNADFANVDRVTWIQNSSAGDFHQFDEIVLTRAMPTVIDFQSLEQAGTSSTNIGSSYSEDGFTIMPASGAMFIWQTGSTRYAGSTGVQAGNLTTIELVKDGGGAFRLAAIDLSRLNPTVQSTTVTFTGHLDGSPVAAQMFTTTTDLAFQPFIFNDDFKIVDRVTWVQEFTPDTHQFDDIVLGDAKATILETATLGATGIVGGFSVSDQFLGARFSLHEPTRITEIGGHMSLTFGAVWGAIIPLAGPGALPPFGYDIEANALASALFDGSGILSKSADLCLPVDVVLPAGDYALVFGGGGLFGSTGAGAMPDNNSDTLQADYFFRDGVGTWIEDTIADVRFIVCGTPLPCDNCLGDADGSGIVNFGDVTTVLGNWLTVCPSGSETQFESATLGAVGLSGGTTLGTGQTLGARFALSEPTRVTQIGGNLSTTGGTVWGAILPLSGPGALPPDGIDIEATALASALFESTIPSSSEDHLESVDVLLAPGDYALVFGADGLFGSTGSGHMPGLDIDIGAPTYFFSTPGPAWSDGGINNTRFVVVGEALCSACKGDADFSGVVNFGDVTAVLGNWLSVCP